MSDVIDPSGKSNAMQISLFYYRKVLSGVYHCGQCSLLDVVNDYEV